MSNPLQICDGLQVRMHYRIILENGTIVDSTFEDQAIEFVIGDGTLHSGLELALLGKSKGDKEKIKIGPEIAYGYADETAIHKLPKSDFPEQMQMTPGTVINFVTPSGDEAPGLILEDLGEAVKVDLNHPLAGHEFDFEYEILDVKET